jgi:hypothetical protein
MALCIECSPAVQKVPGSIPDCDALIASRSGPSLLSSGCSPMLYAEDVGGPGQAPTGSRFVKSLQKEAVILILFYNIIGPLNVRMHQSLEAHTEL